MPVIGPDGIRPPLSGEVVAHGHGSDVEAQRERAELARRLPPPDTSMVAIFGDSHRTGRYVAAPQTTAVGVFGDVKIDLREAIVEHEVVEIQAWTMFGDVKLIVPPGYDVQVRGFRLFGDTKQETRPDAAPGRERRTVILQGYGLFGDVRVRTLEVGEAEPSFWDRFRK